VSAGRIALLVEAEGAAERRQEENGAAEMGGGDVASPTDHLEPVERMRSHLDGELRAHEVAFAALGGADDLIGTCGDGGGGRQQGEEGGQ
jgi:hypothetical protein